MNKGHYSKMENYCEERGAVAGRGKHDIVSSLPLELLVHVVDFLDHIDIIQSQRVSKRWRSIFSSDAILKSILPRTLAALGLETTNAASGNPMSYVRWLVGLELARPVKKVFLPLSTKPSMFDRIAYYSRRLCWIMPDDENVVLLNLETGEKSIFRNDIELPVDRIQLSDRYLLLISDGCGGSAIVAWNVHTAQKVGTQEIYSTLFPVLTIAEDKVIITPRRDRGHISVWDLQSNQVYEFRNYFIDLYLWHADAGENQLVTFDFNWYPYPPKVCQARWTLTGGELLHEKQFRLSLEGRRVNGADLLRTWNDWYHTYGKESITQFLLESDPHTTMNLRYDHSADRLSLRWLVSSEPIPEHSSWDRFTSVAPHIVYRCVQQLKGIAIYNAATGTTTVHPYQLDIRERNLTGADLLPPSHPSLEPESYLRCFGDREVICVASKDGIQLWFFSPGFMPNVPDAEPFHAMEDRGRFKKNMELDNALQSPSG